MTYHDQDRRDYENEPSFGDEQPRFRDRGQHREGRSSGRGPDSASERDFGREQERDYRGGTRHHASRPYLARGSESERSGDERHGRQLDGGARSRPSEDEWPSSQSGRNPWDQEREGRSARRSSEGRSFGQSGWAERAGGSEGSGGFGAGSFSPGSYGGGTSGLGGGGYGAYGGSSYGGGGYMAGGASGSFRGGEGSEYGSGARGGQSEHEEGQRSRQSSGGSSQDGWDGPHAGKGPKGFKRSDERLNEDISDRLERHGQIDASDIEVTCKDGMVTLRGTVDNRRAKRLAEDVAEAIHGVQDVMNELKVQKEGSSSSSSPHERSTTSKADPSRQESTSAAGQGTSSQKR